jgi:hypothetical protein
MPLRPDGSRFELFSALSFPQIDHPMTSTECANMVCATVSGKNPHHKGQTGGRGQQNPSQAAMKRPSQARLRRGGTARIGQARSGGHEATEGETGDNAGSGGNRCTGERGSSAGNSEAPSQEEMERGGIGLEGEPVMMCAKQRNANSHTGLVRQSSCCATS